MSTRGALILSADLEPGNLSVLGQPSFSKPIEQGAHARKITPSIALQISHGG